MLTRCRSCSTTVLLCSRGTAGGSTGRRRPCRPCRSPSSRRTAAHRARRRSWPRPDGSRRRRRPRCARGRGRPRRGSLLKRPAVSPSGVELAAIDGLLHRVDGSRARSSGTKSSVVHRSGVVGHLDHCGLHVAAACQVAVGQPIAAGPNATDAPCVGDRVEVPADRGLVDDGAQVRRRGRAGCRPRSSGLAATRRSTKSS